MGIPTSQADLAHGQEGGSHHIGATRLLPLIRLPRGLRGQEVTAKSFTLLALALLTRTQSIDCFSGFPVEPLAMNLSACWTASWAMRLAGCRTVALMPPLRMEETTSGLPSKPVTITLVLPAATRAAWAPNAMVSLPAMIPLMLGCACRIVCVI